MKENTVVHCKRKKCFIDKLSLKSRVTKNTIFYSVMKPYLFIFFFKEKSFYSLVRRMGDFRSSNKIK